MNEDIPSLTHFLTQNDPNTDILDHTGRILLHFSRTNSIYQLLVSITLNNLKPFGHCFTLVTNTAEEVNLFGLGLFVVVLSEFFMTRKKKKKKIGKKKRIWE